MDAQTVTTVLAVAILVLALPLLVLARAVARGKVSRRSSAIASELGLQYVRPTGSTRDPIFQELVLFRDSARPVVANLMRGQYRGRPVLLADVLELPALPEAGRWGLAGVLTVMGGMLGPLLGGAALIFYPRGSKTTNHLLILVGEPLPALPDFLVEPRQASALGRWPDGEAGLWGLDLNPALLREYDPSGDALHRLPPAFFERAARVLVGRPNRWTVQGARGRLAVWITDWRSPTNLRPARSYRSVLDDALSLRDALESDDPRATIPPDEPSTPRKSIRASLERIRGEPGPNHEGR